MQRQKTLHSLLQVYANLDHSCQGNGITPPRYEELNISEKNRQLTIVEKLAFVWTISIASALHNNIFLAGNDNLQIIRLEDMHGNPEHLSRSLFSSLGIPLSVKNLNRFVRNMKSEFFHVPFDYSDSDWKKGLLPTETKQIEKICCPIMKLLDYDC